MDKIKLLKQALVEIRGILNGKYDNQYRDRTDRENNAFHEANKVLFELSECENDLFETHIGLRGIDTSATYKIAGQVLTGEDINTLYKLGILGKTDKNGGNYG